MTRTGGTADQIAGFADQAGAELARQGFPRVPARVLMALQACEDGTLTASELRETLGLSAGAVSQATSYLEQLGFVRTTTVPGTRRHRYSLTTDHWYAGEQRSVPYLRTAEALEAASRLLPEGSAGRRRADETADFFRFCAERVPGLLDEWHAERAAGRR